MRGAALSKPQSWPESVTVPAASPVVAAPGTTALTAMFGQIGIASFRAAVVNLESMDMQSRWSISAHHAAQVDAADGGPDSAFIAAKDAGVALRDAPAEYTLVRKLSPRVWTFAWRITPDRMIVAEARYRDRRDAMNDVDTVLIRLICLSCMQAGNDDDEDSPSAGLPQLEWPAVDRRRDRSWRAAARSQRPSLLLLTASAVVALWLAFFALPAASDLAAAQQTDASRVQAMADRTMTNALAAALATGDYGEVQNELTGFHALGYFQRAVVINARQRVVASAGPVSEATMGAPLPAAAGSGAKSAALLRGSEQVGQLLSFGKAAEAGRGASFRALRLTALFSFLLAVAAGVALVIPQGWLQRLRG